MLSLTHARTRLFTRRTGDRALGLEQITQSPPLPAGKRCRSMMHRVRTTSVAPNSQFERDAALASSWHCDVLRRLDYLRNVGIQPDSRVTEAIQTVIERRHQNGR